jgi:hypothetical protein
MFVVGLVPLLVLVVSGAGLVVSSIRGRLPYDYTSSLTPGPQGVRVTTDVPTQVLASGDGQVHVTVGGSYAVAQPSISTSTTGGMLDINASCPDTHCDVTLTVEVPASAAVQAKAEGHSIDFVGVASPVTVDASDGSVDLVRIRSPRVSVDTQRGSISMLFDEPPEQVNATASDGSLTVQVPRDATYSLDAVAAQGSTTFGVRNDPSSEHHLYLRTSYGSITVR